MIYFSTLCEVNSKKVCVCKDGRGPSLLTHLFGILTLNFPASRTMKNMYLLFKPPSPWYLLWQPKLTKKTLFKQFFGSFSLSASFCYNCSDDNSVIKWWTGWLSSFTHLFLNLKNSNIDPWFLSSNPVKKGSIRKGLPASWNRGIKSI